MWYLILRNGRAEGPSFVAQPATDVAGLGSGGIGFGFTRARFAKVYGQIVERLGQSSLATLRSSAAGALSSQP
jgi:hypothetical protein